MTLSLSIEVQRLCGRVAPAPPAPVTGAFSLKGGWVEIGIEESASRARISRYELGTHEPLVKTARLIAQALGVPLAYLFCEDDDVAALLLAIAGVLAGSTWARQ